MNGNLSDDELTNIYKMANNIQIGGKNPPISTKFIFEAMRACYTLGRNEATPENPIRMAPCIDWEDGEGPLLVCKDGTKHRLTLMERLSVKAGYSTIEQLDKQYNSEPQQGG